MQKLLKNIHDERLRTYIIWLPMFPNDSKAWAKVRSDEFRDKRVSYYWDGEKLTGKEWQKVLGIKQVAWDVYFLYGPESRWDKQPATPDFWMHHLGSITSAPKLDEAVFEAKAKELLGNLRR